MSNILYRGIDVSTHQGEIDWAKVKATGLVDFAMIRVGFRGYGTSGKLKEDKWFKHNIEGSKDNSIMIGAYFFSTAINEAEAIEEAKFCIERLKDYDVKFPVVYDLEGYNNKSYRSYGISKEVRTANCQAFINTIAEAGYSTMLYGSKSHIRSKFNLDVLDDYYIWVAAYPSDSTLKLLDFETYRTDIGEYTDRIAMWQYSNHGKIDGINAKVDMNVVYVDLLKDTTIPEEVKLVKTVKVELPVLRKDSKGNSVEVVQLVLKNKGYLGADGKELEIDGNFGNNTKYAVTEFQEDNEAECGKADGIIGAKTWPAMIA